MLTLPIKKKWFDMILSGEKREEYRDIGELLRISSIIFWKSWIRKNWQQMRRG